jgi:Prolyl oligopeptidase family
MSRMWLTADERIKWGCDFIGCPSMVNHFENRLTESKLPIGPPWLPRSLARVLERDDPGMILRSTGEVPPTLKTKSMLVLHGTDDPIVPWKVSADFISHLVQQSDLVQVKLYAGVGHETTPEMIDDFYNWLLERIL